MRIAVVSDEPNEIELLRKIILETDSVELAWVAYTGDEAIKRLSKDKPDLILLKLIMPKLDGAETTKLIMQNQATSIIMMTSSLTSNRARLFDAMGYGALDVVSLPFLDKSSKLVGVDDLVKKIATIKKLINYTARFDENKSTQNSASTVKMIAIGSSTGGPKALSTILSNLDEQFSATIVIVQHVDSKFADGLVEWLSRFTKLEIQIAKEGKIPEKGKIYIAGTNDHLIIDSFGSFAYTPEPVNYHYRPSVDRFFESLRDNWHSEGIAILLTGMGNDGAKGLLKLKTSGWLTIAQDEDSSVVYGMPKVAKEIGAADEILTPVEIANKINKSLN